MSMNALLAVKEELENMHRAIARGDGEAISSALTRLDEIVKSERDGLPPRLIHFLERRSYAKAEAFLTEETNTAGGAIES